MGFPAKSSAEDPPGAMRIFAPAEPNGNVAATTCSMYTSYVAALVVVARSDSPTQTSYVLVPGVAGTTTMPDRPHGRVPDAVARNVSAATAMSSPLIDSAM